MLTRIAAAFYVRDAAIGRVYKFHLFLRTADGLLKLAIFYFVGKYLDAEYFAFAFAGIIFGRFFYFFSSAFTDFIKHEQYWGTMEPMLLSPLKFSSTACCAVAAKIPQFAAETLLYAAAGSALGLRFPSGRLAGMLVLTVATSSIFAAVGVFFAGAALRFKRTEQAGWLFAGLVEILSGVYFPVDNLPGALGIAARFFPTTLLLNMWRAQLSGDGATWPGIAAAGGAGTALFFAALIFFDREIRAAQKKGDAGVY